MCRSIENRCTEICRSESDGHYSAPAQVMRFLWNLHKSLTCHCISHPDIQYSPWKSTLILWHYRPNFASTRGDFVSPHLVMCFWNIPHKPTSAATVAHFLSEGSVCHNNVSCFIWNDFETILSICVEHLVCGLGRIIHLLSILINSSSPPVSLFACPCMNVCVFLLNEMWSCRAGTPGISMNKWSSFFSFLFFRPRKRRGKLTFACITGEAASS